MSMILRQIAKKTENKKKKRTGISFSNHNPYTKIQKKNMYE